MCGKVRNFLRLNKILFELGLTLALVIFSFLLYRVTSKYTTITEKIMAVQQEQMALSTTRNQPILLEFDLSFLAGSKIKGDGCLTLRFRNISPVVNFIIKEIHIKGDVYEGKKIIKKGLKLVDNRVNIELLPGGGTDCNVLQHLILNLRGRNFIGDTLDLGGRSLKNLNAQICYLSKDTNVPYILSVEFEGE